MLTWSKLSELSKYVNCYLGSSLKESNHLFVRETETLERLEKVKNMPIDSLLAILELLRRIISKNKDWTFQNNKDLHYYIMPSKQFVNLLASVPKSLPSNLKSK